MSNAGQELIETATELGTLKERQRQLAVQIQFLEDRLKLLAPTSKARPQTAAQKTGAQLALVPAEASNTDAVIHFLNAHPNRIFKAAAIKKAVPGVKMTTLRTTLFRLSKSGRIRKTGHGRYRAMGNRPGEQK